MKKLLLAQEKEAVRLYLSGYTSKQVSKRFSVCAQTILNVLSRHNIPRRGNEQFRKLSLLQEEEATRKYLSGQNTVELAKHYKVHNTTIRSILLRHNIPLRPSHTYHYILDASQITELKKLYLLGDSARSLAKKFRVSTPTITSALKRNGVLLRNKYQRCRKYHINHSSFSAPMTPEAMYWAGLLFADGTFFISNPTPQLSITLKESDIPHLEHFNSFLESDYRIERRDAKCKNKVYPQGRLTISSGPMVARLQEIGMCHGSLNRVANSKLASSRDFWRGVVDGDGCLGIYSGNPLISLCGGKTLVHQFVNFINKFNFTAHGGIYQQGHKLWIAQYSGALIAPSIVKVLYGQAEVALPRKYDIAQTILSQFCHQP